MLERNFPFYPEKRERRHLALIKHLSQLIVQEVNIHYTFKSALASLCSDSCFGKDLRHEQIFGEPHHTHVQMSWYPSKESD